MFQMGLSKVYPCTKFEVSIALPVPNLWKGVKDLKILPLNSDHAHSGDILSSMRWDFPRSIHVPNLKFL